MFTCVLGCYVASTVFISTQTFRREPIIDLYIYHGMAPTASVESCAEIKSARPLQWRKPDPAEFGGRCRKAMLGVCAAQRLT